ncbi:hypothetical protein NKH77_54290 [Streptomyces sp. M19]
MGEILVAMIAKVGVALAEALVARLVYELYSAYVRRTSASAATV